MNGTIAQLVSLVTYGNAYLKDKTTHLTSDNSTLAYSRYVKFADNLSDENSKPDPVEVAQNPNEWFAWLDNNNCQSLKIYYQHSENNSGFKDHMSSAFVGGGGTWAIETDYGNTGCKYWVAEWIVNNENAVNNNIWEIAYHNTLTTPQSFVKHIAINEARKNLKAILSETFTFAEKHNETFAKSFQNALNVIDSPEPDLAYYQDLVPVDSFAKVAKQTLYAAAAAWVFGGMGSWNDSSYTNAELNTEHERLSEILYDNIITAIIAAVNS